MKPVPLWRVFAWDPAAAEGERFSAAFVPGGQGKGRFDLPASPAGVVYLAETEEHAVAEMIARFRNLAVPLTDEDLTVWGRRLALVRVTLDADVWQGIADLCQPATLVADEIAPDHTALRDRVRTQCIAAALFERGSAGLRWWSAFWGEWHTVVLFRERLDAGALRYDTPSPLHTGHPHVLEAARLLGVGP